MKLEDQVVSLELAKRLKELGVRQDSLWRWIDYGTESRIAGRREFGFATGVKVYSAFTVAELGEMLPGLFTSEKDGDRWNGGIYGVIGRECEKEADLRSTILILLIEKGIVDVKELAEAGHG